MTYPVNRKRIGKDRLERVGGP